MQSCRKSYFLNKTNEGHDTFSSEDVIKSNGSEIKINLFEVENLKE